MKLSIFNFNRTAGDNLSERPTDAPEPENRKAAPFEKWDSLQLSQVREQILNRILTAIGVLGVPVYLAALPLLLRSKQWGLIVAAAVILAVILWTAFNRRVPYAVRAALFLIELLAIGWSILLSDGLFGSGRVFLVTIPILAAVFVTRRGRIAWLVLAVAAFSLTGVGMVTGMIHAPVLQPGAGNTSLLQWAAATAVLSMLAIAGSVSLAMLLEGLEKSLQSQHLLFGELEDERSRLELHVQERTVDLERRVTQVRTAAEITGAISRSFSVGGTVVDQLLSQVCELARERFDLYYVGVFLVEEGRLDQDQAQYAVLKAGTGDAGREMLAAGHRLAVGGESMIGWACKNRRARIALDVGAEAVRFSNPYLPQTRSELALPILITSSSKFNDRDSGDTRTLGAMSIQSVREAAFDQDDILALQGIADNLAGAIENARLFGAMQSSLDEIKALHRQYLEGAWKRASAAGDLSYSFDVAPNRAESEDLPTAVPPTLEVPIRLRDQVIGELVLEADSDGSQAQWSAEDRALAQTVAAQAALALENARLLEETQRAADIERKASAITGKLWASGDMETILKTTLTELAASLEAEEGSIELWPAGSTRKTDNAHA